MPYSSNSYSIQCHYCGFQKAQALVSFLQHECGFSSLFTSLHLACSYSSPGPSWTMCAQDSLPRLAQTGPGSSFPAHRLFTYFYLSHAQHYDYLFICLPHRLNSKPLEGQDHFLVSTKSSVPTQCLLSRSPNVRMYLFQF